MKGEAIMEVVTMDKVVVAEKIENYSDLLDAQKGRIPESGVRSIDVADALVDTGATTLSLPIRLIAQLGLVRLRSRQAKTSAGIFEFGVYAPVQLTVQGRDCLVQFCEVPDSCPVLIGQIPLELLDFVVDPVGQRLMGNPEHDGEQMIELY
jgi:predicted aspartyl protease